MISNLNFSLFTWTKDPPWFATPCSRLMHSSTASTADVCPLILSSYAAWFFSLASFSSANFFLFSSTNTVIYWSLDWFLSLIGSSTLLIRSDTFEISNPINLNPPTDLGVVDLLFQSRFILEISICVCFECRIQLSDRSLDVSQLNQCKNNNYTNSSMLSTNSWSAPYDSTATSAIASTT